jgi:Ca2+-binding RTX toxin-like protein
MATINGTSGNDNLIGTPESDDIVGGLGDDILAGGSGTDNFFFNSVIDAARVVEIPLFTVLMVLILLMT